jgi:predicted phosphohydrolase
MKLRYLSDLHLEFIKSNKIDDLIKKIIPNQEEIYILAGDICTFNDDNYDKYDKLMKYINNSFKKTFVILGNHEYYNKIKTIDEINIFLNKYFNNFENISLLIDKFEYYDNYCFVGTTLWSNITDPSYKINDVYSIQNFDYIKYNKLNLNCNKFLEETIENNNNCIIITHHMPSNSLINIKYEDSPFNQWFYSNMDNLIEQKKDKIKCWIYGHTHTPSFKIIKGIPFLCNPIGYPNENFNSDFQKTFSI